MGRPAKYPPEFQREAVELVLGLAIAIDILDTPNETVGNVQDPVAGADVEDDQVPLEIALLVVEIEERMERDEIHLCVPVRLDGADVAPVRMAARLLAGDDVLVEVVDEDVLTVRHHAGEDVVTEVVR